MGEAEERADDFYVKGRLSLDGKTKKKFENARYGMAGSHSGVQICSWTKKAIRGKGVCYKQIFYGVDCHACCQMSPAVAWCQQNCVFCWRPSEWMKKTTMDDEEADSPEDIIEKTVKARKKLICGIGGAEDVNQELFEQSFNKFPSHWAISLSGEPTIYPGLGELVNLLKKRKEVKSIFIVSNGQEPEMIERLAKENALPTQLYISLTAPNQKLFKEVNRPVYADGWQRLNRTLKLLPRLRCRTVVRLTLIKGINDMSEHFARYGKLLENSRPDFLEVKSYMFLGFSRKRLKKENMAPHDYIYDWCRRFSKYIPSYSIVSEHKPSRVVLFKRNDSGHPLLIKKPAGGCNDIGLGGT